MMNNTKLEEFISQLEHLPSQGHLFDEIIDQLKTEEPSIDLVSDLISQDMGMGAKALQLVNSSFFGPRRQVTSIGEAVRILGIEIIRKLFFNYELFSRCESDTIGGISVRDLNMKGLAISRRAKENALEMQLERREVEAAATAGFFSDIGKLLLAIYSPDEYSSVIAHPQNGNSLVNIERDQFGTSHAEVGGYLLGLWGLPDSVVNAAAFYDRSDSPEKVDAAVRRARANLVE